MANIQKNISNLHKRRISKYHTLNKTRFLIRFCQDSPLIKSYYNSRDCNKTFLSNDKGILHATYCKTRLCELCNRIKTAKAISNYLQDINAMQNKIFVTLTIPTCNGEQLPTQIKQMETAFRLIYLQSKKAKYKKEFPKLKGFRKAEITIRPNGQYHYHFHLLLEHEAVAKWLIAQWLRHFPNAKPSAQDYRPALPNTEKELFKYALKADIKLNNSTTAKRYDLVFQALKNKRTYSTFGGIKLKKEEFTDDELKNGFVTDEPNSIYLWSVEDWYSKNTGSPLLGFPMTDKEKKYGIQKNQ